MPADPYQGLQIGSTEEDEGFFFDDFGLGLPGVLGWMGAEWAINRGFYMGLGKANKPGHQGSERLLRDMRERAYKSAGYRKPHGRIHRGPAGPGSFTMRDPQELLQYERLKRDMFSRRGGRRYRNAPLSGLYDEAGGSFGRLSQKYGKGAASRIYGTAVLGKFARTIGTISLAHLGFQLAKGITGAIAEFEPPSMPVAGPQAEFGGYAPDTRTAWTQRQASLMAIHNSGLQARAALGNEAALLH